MTYKMHTLLLVACLVTLARPVAAQRPEGITVRGHWVIDVKNTDGTLASRTEFDNALVEAGQNTLAGLLMGGPPVSGWAVQLMDSDGLMYYLLAEKALENASVVLKTSHKFDSPRTLLTVTSSTCKTANCQLFEGFSRASVPPSTTVLKDQTVDIKVTISFAPAPH